MRKKNSMMAICGLILILHLVSCTNQTEPKVEVQSNKNPEQKNLNSKAVSNKNKLDDKDNLQDEKPIIKPSGIIENLREKKTANPTISGKELAAYGNELLKSNGYDYTFSWEPKGKQNEENLGKLNFGDYLPFEYQFTTANGKSQKFQLFNNGFEHPCYSVIDVPITKVNEQKMTVISKGKEVELKNSKDFYLEEFVLVDKSKKPIRKWKTPIDAYPLGISEDGKKVYFESWEFSQDQTEGYKESPISLAVEISEDGSLRLVDLSEIKSGKGVVIDYDKKHTEIQYEKYKVGKNEFVIKFSAPCT